MRALGFGGSLPVIDDQGMIGLGLTNNQRVTPIVSTLVRVVQFFIDIPASDKTVRVYFQSFGAPFLAPVYLKLPLC